MTGETWLLMVFSDAEKYYLKDICEKQGNQLKMHSMIVQVDSFQDAVLLTGESIERVGETDILDYRYFSHKNNYIEFYSWSGYHGNIYLRNEGEHELKISNPYGFFLIPSGKTILVEKDKSGVKD